MKKLESKIRKFMTENVESCIDSFTGRVNMTMLAETTAHYMEGGKDEWLDDPNHIVWEVAAEFFED